MLHIYLVKLLHDLCLAWSEEEEFLLTTFKLAPCGEDGADDFDIKPALVTTSNSKVYSKVSGPASDLKDWDSPWPKHQLHSKHGKNDCQHSKSSKFSLLTHIALSTTSALRHCGTKSHGIAFDV